MEIRSFRRFRKMRLPRRDVANCNPIVPPAALDKKHLVDWHGLSRFNSPVRAQKYFAGQSGWMAGASWRAGSARVIPHLGRAEDLAGLGLINRKNAFTWTA
jgi:hypothetical protein